MPLGERRRLMPNAAANSTMSNPNHHITSITIRNSTIKNSSAMSKVDGLIQQLANMNQQHSGMV